MKKVIFFALILITGFACFGQNQNEAEDNLTLRDDDLPYDSSDYSTEYSNNEFSNENVESNISNPNSATYVGRVYYFNVLDHLIFSINVVVNRPNFIRYYYSTDGYNYVYYPYASAIVYDPWWSWPLFRYSSWGSFCNRYPSFYRRVNHHCHSLNFGNGEYGQVRNLRDCNYSNRRRNYGVSNNSNYQGKQRSNNNDGFTGGHKNSRQVRSTNSIFIKKAKSTGTTDTRNNTPTRLSRETSYVSPVRSDFGGSYSAPVRSSSKYSTPTRSGSSGGSTRRK